MTDKELLQQALEALEDVREWNAEQAAVRAALRGRLARQEQNPGGMEEWQVLALRAGWRMPAREDCGCPDQRECDGRCCKPARQEREQEPPCKTGSQCVGGKCPMCEFGPARQWRGLTEEQIRAVYGKDLDYRDGDYTRFARAIEAKLREKNT